MYLANFSRPRYCRCGSTNQQGSQSHGQSSEDQAVCQAWQQAKIEDEDSSEEGEDEAGSSPFEEEERDQGPQEGCRPAGAGEAGEAEEEGSAPQGCGEAQADGATQAGRGDSAGPDPGRARTRASTGTRADRRPADLADGVSARPGWQERN